MYYQHILLAFVISRQGWAHRFYFPPSESSTKTCGADSSFSSASVQRVMSQSVWTGEDLLQHTADVSDVRYVDSRLHGWSPRCILDIVVNLSSAIRFVCANRELIVPPADRFTAPVCISSSLVIPPTALLCRPRLQVSLCLSGQATIPGGIPEADDWKAWEITLNKYSLSPLHTFLPYLSSGNHS